MTTDMPVLACRELSLTYGGIVGISSFELTVRPGAVVALLGPNGSGKSSALRAISGEGAVKGEVLLDGRNISRWSPDRRARAGLVQVPQGGGVFRDMSVLDNLLLGGFHLSHGDRSTHLERVFQLFPRLQDRRKMLAGLLSGGEQQMVALGRALMTAPRVVLLDEPTVGLAPVAVTQVFEQIALIREAGVALVVVDQNALQAIKVATDVCVVNRGRLVYAAEKTQALEELNVIDAHLGLVNVDDLAVDEAEPFVLRESRMRRLLVRTGVRT